MFGARRRIAGVVVAATILWPAAARAQDVALAAEAFAKGLADMEAGRYETGCPALAESYRLDPLPGVLFTQAECEARWGKIATAVAHYDDFLRLLAGLLPTEATKHADRRRIAQAQRQALAARVPRLTLVLPRAAPRDVRVEKDGIPLGPAQLGVPLPVDPGEIRVATRSPGGVREQTSVLQAGESRELLLEVAPAPPPPKPTGQPRPPEPPWWSFPPSTPRRTVAYAAGAVGVTGLVIGAVTGALAIGRSDVVDDHCDGPACDATGLEAAEDGEGFATVSTIAFGLGVAGIATAIVLFATEQPPGGTGKSSGARARWSVSEGGPCVRW